MERRRAHDLYGFGERVSVRIAVTQDFARIDLLELRDLRLSRVRSAGLSSTNYLTRSAGAKGEQSTAKVFE